MPFSPKGLYLKISGGHKDDLLQYEYNIEKAKELMKQAGYPDGGFKLLLTYMGGEENERKTAELMKAELKKIGIELEIRGMPGTPNGIWQNRQIPKTGRIYS